MVITAACSIEISLVMFKQAKTLHLMAVRIGKVIVRNVSFHGDRVRGTRPFVIMVEVPAAYLLNVRDPDHHEIG